MSDDRIYQFECPHPECTAMLRISAATPAGVYQCWCHSIRVRLTWITDTERRPFLILEPKEQPAP